ncbi:hypothetical protein TNIN_261231 [Trichonephila inaurata madagascariensis]|uniref:Uncharacterized protein n=1 Tax=Trichonephila inaurata madagascariensis TaxID=2747483 RepID=A0A8X6J684_9ARAC|nr:hypothetical protein TNIN_261231 [Trichonephila inaurata madagascariensis]
MQFRKNSVQVIDGVVFPLVALKAVCGEPSSKPHKRRLTDDLIISTLMMFSRSVKKKYENLSFSSSLIETELHFFLQKIMSRFDQNV